MRELGKIHDERSARVTPCRFARRDESAPARARLMERQSACSLGHPGGLRLDRVLKRRLEAA